ncbi:hypothetical protein O9993_23355 [Vibrio lentus]|nr:hypothetical protein [Vibrio lentus]
MVFLILPDNIAKGCRIPESWRFSFGQDQDHYAGKSMEPQRLPIIVLALPMLIMGKFSVPVSPQHTSR